MNNATAAYSFTVNTNGKNHEFNYTKSKLGFKTFLPLLWPALPIGGILAYQTSSSFAGGMFLWIFYSLGLPALVLFVINRLRSGGSFTIGETGVQMNGQHYAYTDISSFYVKTPKGDKGTVIIQNNVGAGYGVYGAMNAVGNAHTAVSSAANQALKSSLREKNYKVCMLFGEKEVVLAGGLTDKTAKVLLEKIDSLI